MNRHFRDARYYLRRTVETTRRGLEKELEPVWNGARRRLGTEPEPEPTRRERLEGLLEATRRRLDRLRYTVMR